LLGSGFAGRANASAGRVPSAAIFGTGPCEVISANFCSGGTAAAGAAAAAGSGITTSWRAPVLPSMIVTVLVAAGGVGGGFAGAFFSGEAEPDAGPS
jgi:hypothetical protein